MCGTAGLPLRHISRSGERSGKIGHLWRMSKLLEMFRREHSSLIYQNVTVSLSTKGELTCRAVCRDPPLVQLNSSLQFVAESKLFPPSCFFGRAAATLAWTARISDGISGGFGVRPGVHWSTICSNEFVQTGDPPHI